MTGVCARRKEGNPAGGWRPRSEQVEVSRETGGARTKDEGPKGGAKRPRTTDDGRRKGWTGKPGVLEKRNWAISGVQRPRNCELPWMG